MMKDAFTEKRLKTPKKILLSFLLIALCAPITYSINLTSLDLRWRISGGISYLNLKNINRTLQSWAEYQKREALSQENRDLREGQVQKFHYAHNFEAEAIIFFTPRFAASLGTGYIYGNLKEENTQLTIESTSGIFHLVRPIKVTALPLYLSGYYFLPLRKDLTFFLKAGAGIIWAKYIEREGQRILPEETFSYSQLQRASSQGVLFNGGLGLAYEIDPFVSLFLESSLRRAKVNGFYSETEEAGRADLFSLEEYIPHLDYWQVQNRLFTEEPSGENFRSVRKAEVDFSGFSVKIGLLIKF